MAYLDFIKVIPADDGDGFLVILEDNRGPGSEFILDDRFDTEEQAEADGRDIRRVNLGSVASERSEGATQAGMAGGCDAYNDYMGW